MNRIPLFKVRMSDAAVAAAVETLQCGYVGQGPKVDAFEDALQRVLRLPRRPITVNSGTTGLEMAYRLAGINHESVVISTPVTCLATNIPLAHLGATILWADVQPDGLIDPRSVKRIMDERLSLMRPTAVVAVDWGGLPCDYRSLRKAAPGVPIIQDAAHSYMTDFSETGMGDYVCFPGSTPVMTGAGPRRIDSIAVGDKVLTHTGELQRVMVRHEHQYKGKWSQIKAGQTSIACTANHPVLVHRAGEDVWVPAESVTTDDSVYVLTKWCERCGKSRVPFYGHICPSCYVIANSARTKREKVQAARKTGNKRGPAKEPSKSRNSHHATHVVPWMEKFEQDGYRVIPMIYAIPDFIAIRDGKVVAVEVESGTSVKLGKSRKYEQLGQHTYDDVVWITREYAVKKSPRYSYEIVGDLARVPVSRSHVGDWGGKSRTVFNLTVDGDETYFAKGVLVHNCWSFQAIKALTCVDGGAVLTPDSQQDRARLLRWYGLDRSKHSSMRCTQQIEEFGWKWHMNDVAAAIGLANMPEAADGVMQSQENARRIINGTAGVAKVAVPTFDPRSSYWLLTVLTRSGTQQALIDHLDARGIEASLVHARNDVQSQFYASPGITLEGVDAFCSREVCVPCGWWMSNGDVQRVIDALVDYDYV